GSAATGNYVLGNVLEGNGTDYFSGAGVYLWSAAGNHIGDGTVAGRNIISGNFGPGIDTLSCDGSVVGGHDIGTDASGTVPLGNGSFGIDAGDVSNTVIDGNVVSGNGALTAPLGAPSAAIAIAQFVATAQNNTVTNNLVGVGADGTTALPNYMG